MAARAGGGVMVGNGGGMWAELRDYVWLMVLSAFDWRGSVTPHDRLSW